MTPPPTARPAAPRLPRPLRRPGRPRRPLCHRRRPGRRRGPALRGLRSEKEGCQVGPEVGPTKYPTSASYSCILTGRTHGPTCIFWANLTPLSLEALLGRPLLYCGTAAQPEARLGINPIVTLDKQLPNMIENLV